MRLNKHDTTTIGAHKTFVGEVVVRVYCHKSTFLQRLIQTQPILPIVSYRKTKMCNCWNYRIKKIILIPFRYLVSLTVSRGLAPTVIDLRPLPGPNHITTLKFILQTRRDIESIIDYFILCINDITKHHQPEGLGYQSPGQRPIAVRLMFIKLC